jgi:hypothetical protein
VRDANDIHVLTDMNGSKGKDTRKRLELEQSKQSLDKQLDDRFKEYQDIKKSKLYNHLDFWIKFWIGIVVFVRVLVLQSIWRLFRSIWQVKPKKKKKIKNNRIIG